MRQHPRHDAGHDAAWAPTQSPSAAPAKSVAPAAAKAPRPATRTSRTMTLSARKEVSWSPKARDASLAKRISEIVTTSPTTPATGKL